MTPQEFLDQVGEFTWLFSDEFFIETPVCNAVWSAPNYNGDNTITYTSKSYTEYHDGVDGRYKGEHILREYIGEEVIFTKATVGRLSAL